MVKVITIMDDVYADLYRLKAAKNLSFTGAIRFLLKQQRDESRNLINLAGSITEFDVDRHAMEKMRKIYAWNR